MIRNVTLLVLTLAAANMCAQSSPSSTEDKLKQASLLPTSSLATTTCQSTFSSGSGMKLLSFCITANGNILGFTAPQSFKQEFDREGYGICDFAPSVPLSYTDEASNDTGNWLSSSITQPNGPNTFPLTITRLTSDGIWKLKQTFSQNTTDRYIKVVMSLTNLSGVSRNAHLMRYMDVDADGSGSGDVFLLSGQNSLGQTLSPTNAHGVTLAALPNPAFSSAGFIANAGGFDACGSLGTTNTPPFDGDGALLYVWGTGIPAGSTKTVTFEYRAI